MLKYKRYLPFNIRRDNMKTQSVKGTMTTAEIDKLFATMDRKTAKKMNGTHAPKRKARSTKRAKRK